MHARVACVRSAARRSAGFVVPVRVRNAQGCGVSLFVGCVNVRLTCCRPVGAVGIPRGLGIVYLLWKTAVVVACGLRLCNAWLHAFVTTAGWCWGVSCLFCEEKGCTNS